MAMDTCMHLYPSLFRANAKGSTGPRTEAGKAASRRNALRHGILNRSVDLPTPIAAYDLRSLQLGGSLVSEVLGTASALQEINRIWGKLARVLVFRKEFAQFPDGLELVPKPPSSFRTPDPTLT
jgi:hypothetical protein